MTLIRPMLDVNNPQVKLDITEIVRPIKISMFKIQILLSPPRALMTISGQKVDEILSCSMFHVGGHGNSRVQCC